MLISSLWTVTELSKPSNWSSTETNTLLACPWSSCEQCLWTCDASEQCSPGCQIFPSRPRLVHPPTTHGQYTDTYHRDLIHVGLVVQQESRTVQVVTLGCHVQRGQSILKEISHTLLWFFLNGRQCAMGSVHFERNTPFPWCFDFTVQHQHAMCSRKSVLKELLPTVPWFHFSTPPEKHEADVQSEPTLVLEEWGASFSKSRSTTASCPLRAAQCSGVKPSCKNRHGTIDQITTL